MLYWLHSHVNIKGFGNTDKAAKSALSYNHRLLNFLTQILNQQFNLSPVTPIICIQLPVEVLGKRKIGKPEYT